MCLISLYYVYKAILSLLFYAIPIFHILVIYLWPLVLPEAVYRVEAFTDLSHHVLVVGASTEYSAYPVTYAHS